MMAIELAVWYNILACERLFALIKRVSKYEAKKLYNVCIMLYGHLLLQSRVKILMEQNLEKLRLSIGL